MPSHIVTPATVIAALLTLIPFLWAIFFPTHLTNRAQSLHIAARLLCPAVLCTPYALVALSFHILHLHWLALYALLPVAVATLLWRANLSDPYQNGNWRDYLVLLVLGLAVDLRWLEPAWPAHLAIFSKLLLLDAGLYGFLAIRQLNGAGIDLRLRWQDLRTGLREFAFYAPIAVALGLSLGFLHLHPAWPKPLQFVAAPLFTFFFIAVPEEVFFRGWLQNLLERRLGRHTALLLTAVIFGFTHFNKRALHFNWRYVLLATLAGIFYGRAWRSQRRVAASAITHTAVDAVWSLWLR
ncbi:CPBP family intramembrane glutamic endopeptidase [Edaphobacter bradus]|uniref:CPBP family intramembrane glutamic endopeptidase n=1 Tax=Edaphobacter bradus TaxID=2259016 RepID=UPI0021E01002|nr:CPBP family intramembrane glutamic endopeptidase [Edaphobacter bradus]